MKCNNCGNQIPEESKNCPFCGYLIDGQQIKESNLANGEGVDQESLELLYALYNREAAIKAVEKKRKKKKGIIIAAIIMFILCLIVVEIKQGAYNNQLRNIATETMSGDYTNVYADVISMTRMYNIYEYRTSKRGGKIGNETLSDIVFQCETIEGKTIWVSIPVQKYNSNYLTTVSKNKPVHLVGRIKMASRIMKDLEETIGDVFVLEVQISSPM